MSSEPSSELDNRDLLNKSIWITLFSCIDELPTEHLCRVFGVGAMRVASMKMVSREYLAAAKRAQAAATEMVRPGVIGGPWQPPEESNGTRED